MSARPPLAERQPVAPLLVGLGVFAGIGAMLLLTGALAPERLPRSFASEEQLLGANLLLVLVPSYLIASWVYLQRRSWRLLGQVDALLPGHGFQRRLAAPRWTLLLGVGIGFLYAVLFNLPVRSVQELFAGGPSLVGLVSGMTLVWLTAGFVIASRLHVARLFRQAGQRVPIDAYDQSPLEPFARSGMSDMLLTVGAIVLTTVQSVDAMFRFENYLYALAVAIPAALVLLLTPMSSIHARLKEHKRVELTKINALIRAAPKDLRHEAVAVLEPLLQRRERIADLPTWPLNTAMVSRLIIYGVIPPAAWVAAALVERIVSDLLGG